MLVLSIRFQEQLPKRKPPKPESEKEKVTGRVGQMFSKHLICLKYFFIILPAFLYYSLEKRNPVALTVIDSQNNVPSEIYGLEYTKQDLQCSHPIPLVDNSSHYLKMRVTFSLCSVGEGNCSFQLKRG